MLLLRKPSPETIRGFLNAQAMLNVTYPAVGATAAVPPPGYVVDHTRIKLGEGEQVFAAARAGIRQWTHFSLGWAEAFPRDTPIEVGQVVAVLARSLGCWWLNFCRIVYVVQEEGPVKRFGFAYGTLPEHAESGEERFLIEWDQATGSVCYDILAFSRPRHFLARLGYPYTRIVQKRFARDSAATMRQAVGMEN